MNPPETPSPPLRPLWSESRERLTGFVSESMQAARESFVYPEHPSFDDWASHSVREYRRLRRDYGESRGDVLEALIGSLFIRVRGIPKRKDKHEVLFFDYDAAKILTASRDPNAFAQRIFGDLTGLSAKSRKARLDLTSGVIEAAQFVTSPPRNGFWDYVDWHDADIASRWALACDLASRVTGLGPTLACNFMLDIYHPNFCKPDTALVNTFPRIGLLPDDGGEFLAFWATQRLADLAAVPALHLDRALWMLMSDMAVRDKWVDRSKRAAWRKKWIP